MEQSETLAAQEYLRSAGCGKGDLHACYRYYRREVSYQEMISGSDYPDALSRFLGYVASAQEIGVSEPYTAAEVDSA
jgi:hypothetical protein